MPPTSALAAARAGDRRRSPAKIRLRCRPEYRANAGSGQSPAVNPPLQPRISRETRFRSEEHTSELQSLMRISYAVFCLKKKQQHSNNPHHIDAIYNKTTCKNTNK